MGTPPEVRSAAGRTITLDTVQDAARHIYRAAVRTPLVRLDVPDVTRRAPGDDRPLEIYLKLETLQPIGSF